MVTTLTLDPKIRDRLKRYGHAGMTYNEILQAMMDRIDEQEFVADMVRRMEAADAAGSWVDFKDV
ncbi:MAG: hypothetical protein ACYDBQ_00225 [Thermoplasmatota archaeon]